MSRDLTIRRLVAILATALMVSAARGEDQSAVLESRPVLLSLDNQPFAYLLAPGKFELTLDLTFINRTVDLFGVTTAPQIPPFAAGTGNAGAPVGGRGNRLRFQTCLFPRTNVYYEEGRDLLEYPLRGMGLTHQEKGLKYGLLIETEGRPALTLNLQSQDVAGPSSLDASKRMIEFLASKYMGNGIYLHGQIGLDFWKVNSLDPSGPPPQLQGSLPLNSSNQKSHHTGLALSLNLGFKSDLTVGYMHRSFDRPFDAAIPGGITSFDRAYVNLTTCLSPSFVANFRVIRESNQMGGLYPFLYNAASAPGFGRQFGWVEFGLTWTGDIRPFM